MSFYHLLLRSIIHVVRGFEGSLEFYERKNGERRSLMKVVWGVIAGSPWLIAFVLSAAACLVAAANYPLTAFSFGEHSIAFIYEGLFNAAGSIIKYCWIPSVFILIILADIQDREKRYEQSLEVSS